MGYVNNTLKKIRNYSDAMNGITFIGALFMVGGTEDIYQGDYTHGTMALITAGVAALMVEGSRRKRNGLEKELKNYMMRHCREE